MRVVAGLARFGENVVPELAKACEGGNISLTKLALYTLKSIAPKARGAEPAIRKLLGSNVEEIRSLASETLEAMEEKKK